MAAGLVVHVFSVEVSITRDHDTALSALNGPTSFNAAIKRLVADNSRTIAAVNTLIRHFKAMPAKQDVTLGEVGRYFGPAEKASNATQLWMATSDLPMLCAYEP
jgi:hypothetical protein